MSSIFKSCKKKLISLLLITKNGFKFDFIFDKVVICKNLVNVGEDYFTKALLRSISISIRAICSRY